MRSLADRILRGVALNYQVRTVRPHASSGANLSIVLVALLGTAGLGAVLKNGETKSVEGVAPVLEWSRFELVLLEEGRGQIEVPTAPPAAHWLKFELWTKGKPVYHRPIHFRKTATDAQGKALNVAHRWHDGHLYVFVRSGYRESQGRVDLNLSYRGQQVYQRTLPPLPPSQRAMAAKGTKLQWPQLEAKLVRLREPFEDMRMGIRLKAPLGRRDAMVVQRLGTSYLANEPDSTPVFAQLGPESRGKAIPISMGYPEENDAVKFQVTRLRAKTEKRRLTFRLQYNGETTYDRQYGLLDSWHEFAGGITIGLSRFNRAVNISKSGEFPLRIYVGGLAVQSSSKLRLISPARVHGIPVELVNRMPTSEEAQVVSSKPVGDARPLERGETVDLTFEAEVGVYTPVYAEQFVLPYQYDRLPIEEVRNSYLVPFRQ
jgi:hypothetical protein